MSKYSKSVETTGKRLGLEDEIVFRLTEEYLRAFQSKASLKTLNDVAKTVLCFDLACSNLGRGFDKESAIKLSGLKKSAYQNSLHTVQKILDLDKPLTVSELCVQLSCTVVKEDAENLFSLYSKYDNKIKDLAHPQYVTASVYTACKLKNIKVDKSKFVLFSRLKPLQWKELVNQFQLFAESQGFISNKTGGKPLDDLKNQIANLEIKDSEEQTSNIKKMSSNTPEIEPYEVWKSRILKEAYRAMENTNKMEV